MTNREGTVNAHIGQKFREARVKADLSQSQVGQELGISFQQIQKYENGSNRVTAARLYMYAKMMEKPVSWFFDGLDPDPNADDLRAQVTGKLIDASTDKLAAVNTLLSA